MRLDGLPLLIITASVLTGCVSESGGSDSEDRVYIRVEIFDATNVGKTVRVLDDGGNLIGSDAIKSTPVDGMAVADVRTEPTTSDELTVKVPGCGTTEATLTDTVFLTASDGYPEGDYRKGFVVFKVADGVCEQW